MTRIELSQPITGVGCIAMHSDPQLEGMTICMHRCFEKFIDLLIDMQDVPQHDLRKILGLHLVRYPVLLRQIEVQQHVLVQMGSIDEDIRFAIALRHSVLCLETLGRVQQILYRDAIEQKS